jgi:hypothetical protein
MKLSCNHLHSSKEGTSEAMRSILGLQLDDFDQRNSTLQIHVYDAKTIDALRNIQSPVATPSSTWRRSANVRPGYRCSQTCAPCVQSVSEMCPEAIGDDDDHKPSKFFWGKPSPSTSSTEIITI